MTETLFGCTSTPEERAERMAEYLRPCPHCNPDAELRAGCEQCNSGWQKACMAVTRTREVLSTVEVSGWRPADVSKPWHMLVSAPDEWHTAYKPCLDHELPDAEEWVCLVEILEDR